MNDMNENLGLVTRIKEEVADKMSELLVDSANQSRYGCFTFLIGEPEYPIELLCEA